MFVQRFKSEGISHISYFIGQGAEAAVVDPSRDIDAYLDLAQRTERSIRTVLETHRNEDYVSGSQELAAATGAKVYHGGQVPFRFGNEIKDGQELNVGNLRIKAVHTPGHTDESFSYALYDPTSGDHPVMLFCGDALFVGEVGRTDFYGKEHRERLANALYHSLHERIVPLGDSTIICPAHGSGSICGTSIGEREDSTIGMERLTNHALRMSKEEFIASKLAEDMEIAPLMRRMEKSNLEGPKVLGHLPTPKPLSAKEMKHAIAKGCYLLDARQPYSFAGAHIPGAINLWLESIPIYAGFIIPPDRQIVTVVDTPGHLDRLVRYLVRLGYDEVVGYLRVGMDLWAKQGMEIATMRGITAKELNGRHKAGEDLVLIDVRDARERHSGTIPGSKQIHLGQLASSMDEIPKKKPLVTFCGGGYRGSTAASILVRHGYSDVYNLQGGFAAWSAGGFPVER
jgi:hydroxyacylglutathione hydrolase